MPDDARIDTPGPRGVRVALVLGLGAIVVLGAAVVGTVLLAGGDDSPTPRSTLALGTSRGLEFAAADGSAPVVIDGRGPAFGPRWSPDGTALVVAALLPDDPNALVFVHADGAEYGRAGQAASYRWSRDSRHVAVIGMQPLDLRVQDAHTGESLRVVLPPAAAELAGMDWTADGRLVVGIVPQAEPQGRSALWLLDPAGGEPVALAGDAAHGSSYPSVSPDGTRVAVLADGCGAPGGCLPLVRVLDLVSGGRRAEVSVIGPGAELAWSPDGSQLAFDALVESDTREVFAWHLDHGTVPQITDSGRGMTWLNGWVPDGTALLVARQVAQGAGNRIEIWRTELATGEAMRVAEDANGAALQPAP